MILDDIVEKRKNSLKEKSRNIHLKKSENLR